MLNYAAMENGGKSNSAASCGFTDLSPEKTLHSPHLWRFTMSTLARFAMSLLFLVTAVSAIAQTDSVYKLRHGDALTVSVWRDEALRMEVRVLPDGSITFPLAGRVEVVGLSTTEAELRVAEKLKKYIPVPVVTVAITATDGNRVYVLGKVVNPGAVTLTSPETTVLQMLSQVGGLDRFADGNSIRVLRSSPQGKQVLPVRYDDLVKGNQLETNVILLPGDTILVP
jgi:polysaccharide export outer membrane protein